MSTRFEHMCTSCGKYTDVVVIDDQKRLCEDCLERFSTDEDIFVIYYDGGMDDASAILGYIKGTEADAHRCRKALAETKGGYTYNEIVYEAMEDLSNLIDKEND